MIKRQEYPKPVAVAERLREQPKARQNLWAELGPPVAVFLLSAIIVFGLGALAGASPTVAGEISIPTYQARPRLTPWEQLLLSPWQHWDGLWYLKIATHGYAEFDYSAAFFPLYPLIVRLLGNVLQIHYLLAGEIISGLAYLTGLIYIYKLVRLEYGKKDIAWSTLVYLGMFPTSFFFFAIYTESLFLALAVATFYYARKGEWLAACCLGMLASLTRSTGLLLAVPLAVEYLHQRDFSLRQIGTEFSYLLLVPAGTLAYAAYNLVFLGDPLGFLKAQEHWERSFALPWNTLAVAWDRALEGSNIPLATPPSDSPMWQILTLGNLVSGEAFNLAFFGLGVVLALIGIKHLRPAYSAYVLLGLLAPLLNPSEITPLLSLPRFVLVLFPLFFVLAKMGQTRFSQVVIIAVSLALLVLFTVRFASWYWVA